MRQIALGIETTGFETALGHRITEIAGIEIINPRLRKTFPSLSQY